MSSKNILGNAIRQARMNKNMTQEGLAELIEITPIHLKHIEGGQGNPSVPVLFKLARVLEFSIDGVLLDSEVANIGSETDVLKANISYLVNKCNEKELNLIIDLIKAVLDNRETKNQGE